jgi:ABC-2 type transport system ATP-binding protein/lipopolysaccharide transport system ATP-binding protein
LGVTPVASIDLKDIAVHIPIYNARGRDMKSMLIRRTVGGVVGAERDSPIVVVKALDGVTLRLAEGDRVALVGGNGAGKTTLLRVMARIYPPTAGVASIDGRVSALTDLMMGMDVEASGRENIVLRGAAMGLTPRQSRAIAEDVVRFADLGAYIDLPIRTYSAGMLLRLAFAVSTAVQPEIVVLDEMIGAGDAAFLIKAKQRMEAVLTKARILVLASHDDDLLRDFCDKAVWMREGKVALAGALDEVLAAYSDWRAEREAIVKAEAAAEGGA